jgi:hypothetical protein
VRTKFYFVLTNALSIGEDSFGSGEKLLALRGPTLLDNGCRQLGIFYMGCLLLAVSDSGYLGMPDSGYLGHQVLLIFFQEE